MTEQQLTLTPEQALSQLDQAVAKLTTTRDGHILLQKSVEVLQSTITGYNKYAKGAADKEAKKSEKEAKKK